MCPMETLTSRREVLHFFSRPAFAFASLITGYRALKSSSSSSPHPTRRSDLERAGLLAMGVSGAAGVLAVLRRQGGFSWLSHSYESVAWVSVFGGISVAAALTACGATPGAPLLGTSAGCAVAATAGERLGSVVGRALLGPVIVGGLASAWLATSTGETRYDQAWQYSGLVLLPVLHLCPPVYTGNWSGLISIIWFVAAALCATVTEGGEIAGVEITPAFATDCLVALGTRSLISVYIKRRPICHY